MFKLQKNYNKKSILTRNFMLKSGQLSKYNSKLYYSMLVSNLGVYFVEFQTEEYDNIAIDLLKLTTISIAIYEILLEKIDLIRKRKSIEKIQYLSKLLNEKGIYINLFKGSFSEVEFNLYDKSFIGKVDFFNGAKLLSENDKTFYYIDSEKKIDITDEVNKALVNKKK